MVWRCMEVCGRCDEQRAYTAKPLKAAYQPRCLEHGRNQCLEGLYQLLKTSEEHARSSGPDHIDGAPPANKEQNATMMSHAETLCLVKKA